MTNLPELIEFVLAEIDATPGIPENKRLAANAVRRAIDERFPLPKPSIRLRMGATIQSLAPMTPREAYAYGNQEMLYGRHAGTRIRDIPRDYLEWLGDEKRQDWQQLRRYLMTSEVVAHAETD
jgi:uncharacterized protein (DUF3820 family)